MAQPIVHGSGGVVLDSTYPIYVFKFINIHPSTAAQLKCNFFALTERYASGKQELFMLCVPERREKLYLSAFLELFQSQYTPHVGDVERLAGKKTRRLYITLPNNYNN